MAPRPAELTEVVDPDAHPSQAAAPEVDNAKAPIVSTCTCSPSISDHVVKGAGMLLAMFAGLVNTVSFFGLGTFTSHVTGSTSKLGMHMEAGDEVSIMDAGMLILSFMLGSTVCGMLIAKNTVHLGMALYGIALVCNSSLLCIAYVLCEHSSARYFAAAACGLQNGMATSYYGAVMRTTHVTGSVTDIGLIFGRFTTLLLRKAIARRGLDKLDQHDMEQDARKLALLSSLFASYLVGSLFGASLFKAIGMLAFLVPASMNGFAGICYAGWRICCLNQALFSTAEMDMVELEVVQVVGDAAEGPECKNGGILVLRSPAASSPAQALAVAESPASRRQLEPASPPTIVVMSRDAVAGKMFAV